MKVLIDTPIWSLAFRRKAADLGSQDHEIVVECAELVRESRAAIIGPVRQETLSGIRGQLDFEKVRSKLAAIADTPLLTADHEEAARFYNYCRSKGVSATSIDLMIWAAATRLGAPVFTTDADFSQLAKISRLQLHQPRSRAKINGNDP